jgi:hypothetical protein
LSVNTKPESHPSDPIIVGTTLIKNGTRSRQEVVTMDWLMHHPIADMYGPHFLLFYGGVIVLTLVVCWWRLHQSDPTALLPPLQVPSDPDPYEIAYLRGGEHEVTRVVIFNLIQQGYLWKDGDTIRPEPNCPDVRHLSEIERKVFGWFPGSLTPRVTIHGL